MTSYIGKMTSKGQITIPKAVREECDLGEGDFVVFEPVDGGYAIRKGQVLTGDAAVERFEALAERISSHFEEHGITRSDVEDAIRWAREG